MNAGYSWGLKHPVIYGWRPERGTWCAWDRHTGKVHQEMLPIVNIHGYDRAEFEIKNASMPVDYLDHATDEDNVA